MKRDAGSKLCLHNLLYSLHSLFVFENYPIPKGEGNGAPAISMRKFIEKVDYPLSILSYEHGDALTIELQYDGKYLKQEKANCHIETLEKILHQIVKNPSQSHKKISLLGAEEYHQLVYGWNATEKEYPKDRMIHELFQEQVERTPNNTALVYEGQKLTYKELNERSNQLARHLRARYRERSGKEMGSGTLTALCLERGFEMVVGILGVLKAGGAYVPMDPAYPQERIDYLLADTNAELVLTQQKVIESGSLQLPQVKSLYIDLTDELYQQEDKNNLAQHSQATDLAYVIYTSGTMGKPKGVMVEHGTFLQFIYNFNDYLLDRLELNNRDILCLTNYVFDIFGLEYALPLITGSKIALSSISNVEEEEILDSYIIQQTPNTLLQLVTTYPDKLSSIICLVGGEALPTSIAEKLIRSFNKVFNVYGPAETVIWSTAYEVKNPNKPYIGKPLFNEYLYVLDSHRQPVPIGVIGELYIGGAGLARGYLNNKELTQERFVPNPFAMDGDKKKGYTRLYKTGDLARWLPDGNLEYIGRNDEQVKIRGYRIELGEIEHALVQVEGIKQACVLAKERKTDTGNTKYLVGYYVLEGEGVLTQTTILEQLSKVLPEYMVPAALVEMESFPLTINGKLDRRALPDPDFSLKEQRYVEPRTEVEKVVAKIWQDVLGLDRVGVTDDFFRMGGNSILAIQASHKMSKVLECDVRVADVFKYKCVETLTKNIVKPQVAVDDVVEWRF